MLVMDLKYHYNNTLCELCLLQRGCQRAVDAIVETGEEADSPDKADISHTVCHGPGTSTKRKLDMTRNDDGAKDEMFDVVAFARRGSRNRDGKHGGIVSKKAAETEQGKENSKPLTSKKPVSYTHLRAHET